MILACHQPNFLPNLSFFYKMSVADVFVIVTRLQFEKGEGWQRRNKIKTAQGDQWLTVPVIGSQNQLIKNVAICNATDWQNTHYHVLQSAYSHTPEPELLERVLAIYQQRWERLVDLNITFIQLLKDTLEIPTKLVLDEEIEGRKEELITNICRTYEADTYLSGVGGKEYLSKNHYTSFARRGISCNFVEYNFNQTHPYSSLHYLLTLGRHAVQHILQDQRVTIKNKKQAVT